LYFIIFHYIFWLWTDSTEAIPPLVLQISPHIQSSYIWKLDLYIKKRNSWWILMEWCGSITVRYSLMHWNLTSNAIRSLLCVLLNVMWLLKSPLNLRWLLFNFDLIIILKVNWDLGGQDTKSILVPLITLLKFNIYIYMEAWDFKVTLKPYHLYYSN